MSAHSNLPPAARKQVKEANRMIQEQQQQKGAAPPPVALTPVPGASPALQPMPEFVSVGAPMPPDAQPAVPPAAAPPNEPPPDATAMPPPDAAADHRYKVLQGKYTAEKRRDAARIAQLEQTVNNLAARPQAAPAPPPIAAQPQTVEDRAQALGLTKAEVAEYGSELIDMIMRVAGNMTAPQIRALAAEQQRLSGAVNTSLQQNARTARELVYDALGSQVSNWEAVNDSPEFLDWLGEHDIFSGGTRNAGLMRAFENNDATRVVGIFKAYLAEDARTRSTARTPSVDPATLIAPGQPAGGGTPAPKGGDQSTRIWLESEVRDFYSLVRTKRISKTEAQAMEAEINLALIQGRIRPEHNDQNLANAR